MIFGDDAYPKQVYWSSTVAPAASSASLAFSADRACAASGKSVSLSQSV